MHRLVQAKQKAKKVQLKGAVHLFRCKQTVSKPGDAKALQLC